MKLNLGVVRRVPLHAPLRHPVHVTRGAVGPEVGPLVAGRRATHNSRVRHQETHGLVVSGILLENQNYAITFGYTFD